MMELADPTSILIKNPSMGIRVPVAKLVVSTDVDPLMAAFNVAIT